MIREAIAIYRAIERRPDAGTDEVLSAILRDWRKNVPRRAANAGVDLRAVAKAAPASIDRPHSRSSPRREQSWAERKIGPTVE